MFRHPATMTKTFLLFLVLFLPSVIRANDSLCLIFVGDVMQHMPQVNSAYKDDTYDYTHCFQYVKDELSSVDLAVANLEAPLAGKPYSGYPQFSAPDEIASALKDAGFGLLLTANNHSCDKYAKGIRRTLEVLDTLNIAHTGTFLDSVDRSNKYPLIIERNNFKLAFLNYTYGTNGIAIPSPYIVNLIDTVQMVKDIADARSLQPDLIIVVIHWGNEYARKPTEEQKKLADFMSHHGVSIIIGAHPHVVQHMEKRYASDGRCNQFIAYSLGNFVSNQSQPNTDGGAMVKLTVTKDSTGINIPNVAYNLVWVYKPIEHKRRHYFIFPAASFENNADFMDEANQKKMNTFLKNSRLLLNKENIGVCEYKL